MGNPKESEDHQWEPEADTSRTSSLPEGMKLESNQWIIDIEKGNAFLNFSASPGSNKGMKRKLSSLAEALQILTDAQVVAADQRRIIQVTINMHGSPVSEAVIAFLRNIKSSLNETYITLSNCPNAEAAGDHINEIREDNTNQNELLASEIGEGIRTMIVRATSDSEVHQISVQPPLRDAALASDSIRSALANLSTLQVGETRDRVNLLICNLPGATAEAVSLLHSVKGISNRPYLVAVAKNDETKDETEVLGGVADQVVPEGTPEAMIISSVEDDVRVFSLRKDNKSSAKAREGKEVEMEPRIFEPSKFSPLPKLPLTPYNPLEHEHNLLLLKKKLKGVHALATFDADGTLIDTGSEDTILLHAFAEWIRDHHKADFKASQGNFYYLEQLIDTCNKWEEERRMVRTGRPVQGARSYVAGIEETGNMSAWAFAGLPYTYLQRYAFEFMQTGFQGRIYGYVPEILKMTKEYGIMPVIVSGMPDVLIPPFLKMTNLRFGNGMTYKVVNGIIQDEVETNMGLPEAKAELDQKLIEIGYAILFMMGDSQGDAGLAISAVHRSPEAKWDFSGAAVIVNASNAAAEEFRRHHHLATKRDRVQIPARGASANKIVSATEEALRSIFEPSAKFINLRSSPSDKAFINLMESIKNYELQGRPYPNLENIKRQREILVEEGLSQADVREMLLRYYPRILVNAVMKEYIEDRRRLDDMRAYYTRIGCTRAEVERLISLVEEDNRKRGISPIVQKRVSTPPPMEAVQLDDD